MKDLGHRPKFLDCIMTPAIISRIRENQEFYDKDPEGYERREKQREEERQEEKFREEQEEREYDDGKHHWACGQPGNTRPIVR